MTVSFSQLHVANPVGGALGQLISPLIGTTRQSVSHSTSLQWVLLKTQSRFSFSVSYRLQLHRSSFSSETHHQHRPVRSFSVPIHYVSPPDTVIPPAYSGSQASPSLFSLLRAMAGRSVPPNAYMSHRERIDFAIIIVIFGTLVAA